MRLLAAWVRRIPSCRSSSGKSEWVRNDRSGVPAYTAFALYKSAVFKRLRLLAGIKSSARWGALARADVNMMRAFSTIARARPSQWGGCSRARVIVREAALSAGDDVVYGLLARTARSLAHPFRPGSCPLARRDLET